MVDLVLLNSKMRDSGMTITAIAEKSGISRETLYNKMSGSADFKASEILNLSNTLRLSALERDEIFFAE